MGSVVRTVTATEGAQGSAVSVFRTVLALGFASLRPKAEFLWIIQRQD